MSVLPKPEFDLPHGFKRWFSFSDIERCQQQFGEEWQGQTALHNQILESQLATVDGFCAVCGCVAQFAILTAAGAETNWRETLVCSSCGLINRWRISLHLLRLLPRPSGTTYVTEQMTPLFTRLQKWEPNVIGSEFVPANCNVATIERAVTESEVVRDDVTKGESAKGEAAEGEVAISEVEGGEAQLAAGEVAEGERVWRGSDGRPVRHEDVTALTFADGSLASVLTFDVIEHVPDYRKSLVEFARVLQPGGLLLLTAPFLLQSRETVVRARRTADGDVEHLLPPVYHGDPLSSEGVLCYQDFGWDLIDDLRAAGFRHVEVITCWAPEFGYLGACQPAIAGWR